MNEDYGVKPILYKAEKAGLADRLPEWAIRAARTEYSENPDNVEFTARADAFMDEEILITLSLSAAVDEVEEEVIARFEQAFAGDLTRIEAGLSEADSVMRNLWNNVDEAYLRDVYATAVVRGGRLTTGLRQTIDDYRFIDPVLDGMVSASKYYTNNYFSRIVMPTFRSAIDNIVQGEQLTSARLFQVTRELLEARLQSVPYWRVVANAGASRAYHYGALKAGQTAQYRQYRIVTIADSRRSDICRDMDGRTFWVANGVDRMEAVAGANDDDIAEVDPWVLNVAQIEGRSDAELSDDGILVPPFHPNCRSTIRFF